MQCVVANQCFLSQQNPKQTKRNSRRMSDGCLSTRQWKRQKRCYALKAAQSSVEEFASPNRTIRAVACAVPDNRENFPVEQVVFSHARNSMRVMMLDMSNRSAMLGGPARREVFRMQVTGKSRCVKLI